MWTRQLESARVNYWERQQLKLHVMTNTSLRFFGPAQLRSTALSLHIDCHFHALSSYPIRSISIQYPIVPSPPASVTSSPFIAADKDWHPDSSPRKRSHASEFFFFYVFASEYSFRRQPFASYCSKTAESFLIRHLITKTPCFSIIAPLISIQIDNPKEDDRSPVLIAIRHVKLWFQILMIGIAVASKARIYNRKSPERNDHPRHHVLGMYAKGFYCLLLNITTYVTSASALPIE